MTVDELAAGMAAVGQPAYRARQVAEWVFKQGAANFAAMSNLPAALREQLAGEYRILTGKVALRSDAPDGTVKLLLEWPDTKRIETVLIPSGQRPDGRASSARATACRSWRNDPTLPSVRRK